MLYSVVDNNLKKYAMTPPSPRELSTKIGTNSWKNGCQNSVGIHHCFNEPGATVAKEGRKTMLLRCSSAFKFPFVNYSLIRGHNDHQNVSKCPPYRVGQFVTKTGPIYTWICELWLKGRVFLIELNSVRWLEIIENECALSEGNKFLSIYCSNAHQNIKWIT